MREFGLIQDLLILLLVSLPINIAFHKVKLPSVMGFLIAGILIGPNGLRWIGDPHSVEALAEIGVVLLLFVIGLEFSLRHILQNLASVVGCGALQMLFTSVVIFLVFEGMGFPRSQGILIGLLAALSSTAIVLKLITDLAEIDTLHGKICIGALLFQDLCVVPIMLIIPLLGQTTGLSPVDLSLALLKSLAAVVAIFFFSRLAVPRTLEFIARMGSKEHLTLFVILLILGTGWLSHAAGLSLAMGAFIAGLILSDSEYNHQIILDILPLKDYFGSIFFISVGMLLQTRIFLDSIFNYLGLAVAVIVVKAILTLLACLLTKSSLRIAFVVGIRLAQVGEFSLLLAGLALGKGLFSEELYQSFLIVSILSMLAAPILIQMSSNISIKLWSRFGTAPEIEDAGREKEGRTGHVIIAGYGLVGRNLARVLNETHIPFLVLELNGERIKRALVQKMPAHYGDATHRETLLHAGIQQARMIVFSISDHTAAEQGIKLARELNPKIYILTRTRFASQVEELNAAGADQVIPEEFETSIEIFSRVLKEFHVPQNIIEQQVELARLEGYSMFRGLSLNMERLRKFSVYLAASLTESFYVLENSWSNDKTLRDLELIIREQARLIAVIRHDELHANPDGGFRLQEGDIVILFGRHAQLAQAVKIMQDGPTAS
ncbi:MAG: cation:proton antiporter [Nitrospinales bacterium]